MEAQFISNQQLLSNLHWRYATKIFDRSRKIPAETWNTIEAALVLSPSSFGLQPYRFLVIGDADLREQLLPHTWKQSQVVDASHYVVFAARTTYTAQEIDEFLQLTAETRNIPLDSLHGYRGMMTGSLLSEKFASEIPAWSKCQAYIALGQLMTSAATLGIDTCPIEGFIPAEYDRILGLPQQGLAAVVCCALGYRSPQDKYATLAKVRPATQKLIRHL